MFFLLVPVPPCELPVAPAYAVDVAAHQQVILVAGQGKHSSFNTVSRWEYRDGCWTQVASVAGRNGAQGWHHKPWDYSYLSPIGSFGLTDAGGRLVEPAGTQIPYDHDRRGFTGPAGREYVFDYVVAINFNRYPGNSPLDLRRPNPKIKDGGIWMHVRGTAATRGCVSVSRAQMRKTLRWLDPDAHPVIVMGPRAEVMRG